MAPATTRLILDFMQTLAAFSANVPGVLEAAGTVTALMTAGTDPTPDQEATIRAALDLANASIQSG